MQIQEGISSVSQSIWWGIKASQKMSDAALLKHTIGKWQTLEGLIAHLANRPVKTFMLPLDPAGNSSDFIKHHYPAYVSAVLAEADAASRNEFTLVGKKIPFSGAIDWHVDPVSGTPLPQWHISRIGQFEVDPGRKADLIYSWELNRHQFFVSLGMAYFLTGDEKYVQAFTSQIQSWIDANPLQHGLNWYEAMQVSIRLIAWITAFQFFRNSPEFQGNVEKQFLKSLWQQADFLSEHLQTGEKDIPNNHLIGELAGLILVGSVFPEFRESEQWRKIGLKQLVAQVNLQTFEDGVNKEQATGYHRFVAEFLILVITRARQGALPAVPELEQVLERMLDYLLFCLTPAETPALWGDSDNGQVLGLGKNRNFLDFRPLLSTGAALYQRSDWKYIAGSFDEESFLLLGEDGYQKWENLTPRVPGQTSRGFSQSGVYILRDSWLPDSDLAFFRCGSFGWGGESQCSHAHADLLSLMLWINGRPLLVDTGTFTYTGVDRDDFRLTAAHNTVMVDGIEQATPMRNFGWLNIPEARCSDWSGKEVTGSLTCPGGVIFTRTVRHPAAAEWDILDYFSPSNDIHRFNWFYHFAPGLSAKLEQGANRVYIEVGGKPLASFLLPEGVEAKLVNSWCSSYYGKKEPIYCLEASWQGMIDQNHQGFAWKFTGTIL